jgi:2-polyprenyl-3-methyl-5-hydroxy-6-metoxy-1,4-benzoquinol methylase
MGVYKAHEDQTRKAENAKANQDVIHTYGIADYDAYWKQRTLDDPWWERVREKEIVVELAAPPKKVLEMGPGGGHLFWDLHKAGYDMYAVDIAQAVIDNLKAPADHVKHCDLNNGLPDFGTRFGAIVGSMVLHHIVRPDVLLEQLKNALEPGGILVLTIPNIVTLKNRVRMLRGKLPKMSLSHRNFQTPKEVAELMERKGLKVLRVVSHRKKLTRSLFPTLFSKRLVVVAQNTK